jgi:ABC-2 type transport system ATP-binding protein
VIVIDHGKLIYDGDLKALVRRVRPDKRLTLRLSAPVERAVLEKLGTVVTHDQGHTVLSVAPALLNATVQGALSTLPVADLSVEDPPLEEVMRELFQGSAVGAANTAGRPAAGDAA